MEVVQEYMQGLYDSGLYPDHYICHQKRGNLVEIEEEATGVRREVLTFCTNDVLGLVQSEAVKQAAIDAILQYEIPIIVLVPLLSCTHRPPSPTRKNFGRPLNIYLIPIYFLTLGWQCKL